MSKAWLGWLYGFIGVAIFATSLPVSRIAVAGLHPAMVGIGRAAVAGMVGAIILLVLDRSWPTKREFALLALGGWGIALGFPFFTALAMATLPSSYGAVLLGVLPLGTAAMAMLVARERPSTQFWLVALLGSALVLIYAYLESGGAIGWGNGWLFAAIISASVGYAFSGLLSRGRPGWWVICWNLVLYLPITSIFLVVYWPTEAVTTLQWSAFLWGALLPQLIGFFAWNAGLGMGGIAKVGQIQLLQVFLTLGFSALLLSEQLSLRTVLFAVAVVGCVILGRKTKVKS